MQAPQITRPQHAGRRSSGTGTGFSEEEGEETEDDGADADAEVGDVRSSWVVESRRRGSVAASSNLGAAAGVGRVRGVGV